VGPRGVPADERVRLVGPFDGETMGDERLDLRGAPGNLRDEALHVPTGGPADVWSRVISPPPLVLFLLDAGTGGLGE
jgi:hypothetical protein